MNKRQHPQKHSTISRDRTSQINDIYKQAGLKNQLYSMFQGKPKPKSKNRQLNLTDNTGQISDGKKYNYVTNYHIKLSFYDHLHTIYILFTII